ncbi:MAG: tyrosine-type recombinase/integrase [Pseudomonadales bacterium]|nr:tyrosine-type recombinase/integrase [Pseudomonadales bacterium]
MKTLKNPPYTYRKRSVYYFSKAVPQDLADFYARPRIVKSLRTKSLSHAKTASRSLSARLEDYWLGLRLQQADVPAAHLLVIPREQLDSKLPTIEDALEVYLTVKGQAKGKLFFSHAKRNISYVVSCLGSRPLDCYSTADAATFRQWLIDKNLSNTSLTRIFGVVKAVINFCIKEQGLDCKNPFSGVYLPTENNNKRYPIKDKKLQVLQRECVALDDDIRWLVALISDSGMRLSEAVGLLVDDIVLSADQPHINLTKHPHRRLKTDASERIIPLVGSSLWAAKRIKENTSSRFCFPRYCSETNCNSNSASAAINKWIKTIVGSDAVTHGLRHSFRDRLRAVEAPVDMIDQLGGWSLRSVGQSYGDGYPLDLLHRWMERIAIGKQ